MTAIVDYGVGNLFSLKASLGFLGDEAVVTGDEAVLREADRIILPGVGAFGDAAEKLRDTGLDRAVIREAGEGKPLLGICLGMQLLFDVSYEYGENRGLGLVHGAVKPLEGVIPASYKIPHIGWNALSIIRPTPIYKYIHEGDHVYFVHSYYATDCDDTVTAVSEYGTAVTASVQSRNIYGCQFHPEKSGSVGLAILRAFTELKGGTV